jgi:hypothetical protein
LDTSSGQSFKVYLPGAGDEGVVLASLSSMAEGGDPSKDRHLRDRGFPEKLLSSFKGPPVNNEDECRASANQSHRRAGYGEVFSGRRASPSSSSPPSSDDDQYFHVSADDQYERERELKKELKESEESRRALQALLYASEARERGLREDLYESEERRRDFENLYFETQRQVSNLKEEMEKKDQKLKKMKTLVTKMNQWVLVYEQEFHVHVDRARRAEAQYDVARRAASEIRTNLYEMQMQVRDSSEGTRRDHGATGQSSRATSSQSNTVRRIDSEPQSGVRILQPRPNHGRIRLEADGTDEEETAVFSVGECVSIAGSEWVNEYHTMNENVLCERDTPEDEVERLQRENGAAIEQGYEEVGKEVDLMSSLELHAPEEIND